MLETLSAHVRHLKASTAYKNYLSRLSTSKIKNPNAVMRNKSVTTRQSHHVTSQVCNIAP